jgi:alcohol dehydrogenase class IV
MVMFQGKFELYLRDSGLQALLERLYAYKDSNVILMYDDNLSQDVHFAHLVDQLQNFFTRMKLEPIVLNGEPTYDDLDKNLEKIHPFNPELLIAVGGGSILDLGKGTSVLLTNSGRGVDYRGLHKVRIPGIPTLMVPTTAGTGSEMTWTASFIEHNDRVKLGINGDHVFPTYGLLLPELMINCPRSVLLSAALDAMVHSVEAITSRNSNPFSTSIAVEAVIGIMTNLPAALEDRQMDSLFALQIASTQAGLAMLNSSGGPASGISYPLGVDFKVPHGFAGGILLPQIVSWNISSGYEGFSKIDQRLGSQSFEKSLTELYSSMSVLQNFNKWGFHSEEHVQSIAKRTWLERRENLELNPLPFLFDDLLSVLRAVT